MIRTGLPGKPWGSAADACPISASAAMAATHANPPAADRPMPCAPSAILARRAHGAASAFKRVDAKENAPPMLDGASSHPSMSTLTPLSRCNLASDRAPATVRAPEIQQSIEIFGRHCLGHCRPQQYRREGGSCRQDQKTFPMAQRLKKKAGCRGADRSGDGDQGADEPAHQVEAAGAGGQIGDHQDCEYGNGRSADAAE